MLPEVFKPIPGFPDYIVGSFGTVVRCRDGATRKAGHVLSHNLSRTGHARVKLSVNGVKSLVAVHRLVAMAHVGMPADDANVCRHYDDTPSNNCVLNLLWGTHMDNHNDRRRNGNAFTGERNGRAKLTAAKAAAILGRYDGTYGCGTKLAREFGVCSTAVYDIIKGRKWRKEIEDYRRQGGQG